MPLPEKKRYNFGAAKELYEKGKHPRLFIGPGDLETINKKTTSGDGRKIMAALRRRTYPLFDTVHGSEDLARTLAGDGTWHSPGARIYLAINDMAMVAALDRDPEAVSAMHKVFDSMCRKDERKTRAALNILSLTIPFDLLYDTFTAEQKKVFIKSAKEEIASTYESLKDAFFKRSGSNIQIGRLLRAIYGILVIRGEKEGKKYDKEMKRLIQCFEASLHTTTGRNGYPEEDTGYGVGVSASLFQTGELLCRAGLYDMLKHCPRIKHFGQAVLHILEPWKTSLSNTGDHGDDFGHREYVLTRLATINNDPTLLWFMLRLSYNHGAVHPENKQPDYWIEVSLGKGIQVPASYQSLLVLEQLNGAKSPPSGKRPTAYMDPDRGVVSFRNGWKSNLDSFVFFDASQRNPSTQGHFHASSGHFSLSAVGEYFSIGTGRYCVDQDQHSVVLINGQSGRSTHGEWTQCCYQGNLIDYQPDPFCDFAAVDSSHQHEAMWAKRYLGLVKGPEYGYCWVVDDINHNNDWDEFWWQLQTSPENVIKTGKDKAMIAGWRHGNKLDVHFVLPKTTPSPKAHTLEVTQDIKGASSYKYLARHPASAKHEKISDLQKHVDRFERPSDMVHGPCYLRPRLLAKIAGYNGRFMSLLLPRLKSERAAMVKRLECLPNSLAARISFREVTDTIIFAYEHNILEVDGISGRGQWCVVRRCKKSGKVIKHTLGHGTELAVDGKPVI